MDHLPLTVRLGFALGFLGLSHALNGSSDIYVHTLAPLIFLGFKVLGFNIFGGFRKMNIFLGYKDFMDII